MRRRLVISTVAIVLVVLGALAVPVGLIVFDAAEGQLEARLEQQAQSVVDAWERSLALGTEPSDQSLRGLISPADGLIVVAADGTRAVQDLTSDASSARIVDDQASDGTRFRLSTASDPLNAEFRRLLQILLLLALGAIAAAAGLAAVQA